MGDRSNKKRLRKPVAACVIAGSLLVGTGIAPGTAAFAATATAPQQQAQMTAPQLALLEESMVTAGVKLRNYRWTRMKNNQIIGTNVKVIIADLQNPNVKLDVMTGQGGQFTKKETVLNMSRETNSVAGVNADFFDMGNAEAAPLGPQVAGAELMATPTISLQGMYAFGVTKQNKPIIETFTTEGVVTAANGQTYTLSGLNRNVGTLGNAMYKYTSAWGSGTRAKNGANPLTEVLVVDGVVTEIAANGVIAAGIPDNGYIVSGAGKAAEFIAANVRVGDKLQADALLKPVNPNLTYTENDFQMLVGGHTMLLIDGAPAAYTRDVTGLQPGSNTSRTAVGFTEDQRYVYLVVADHADDSVGPTLPDFQKLLAQLGVWRAVNLDGGGSTTLVSRPLGDFEAALANDPKEGSLRRVVNGIGVFSTAAPAALKEFIMSGPSLLWKGQTGRFALKAYDVNYNPLDPAALGSPVLYKTDGSGVLQLMEAGAVTAAAAGKGKVTATSGKVSKTAEVEVADFHRITSLTAEPSIAPSAWKVGDAIGLSLKATLDDGRVGTIPPHLATWEPYGVAAQVQEDGTLTFLGFQEGVREALLVAKYDGFSTPLAIPVPQLRNLSDFETVPWGILPEKYPEQAVSAVQLKGDDDTNVWLGLAYDFAAGDGATDLAAYATFNGTTGLPIADGATAMKLDVFGDGQGARLRAEFTDAAGQVQRMTIAENVDWEGWKSVTVDLKEIEAAALKRIYVLSKQQLKGEIGIDNISLQYPEQQRSGEPLAVQLTIGEKDVAVAGQPQQMDTPPMIEQERTFVPVRFVVDALGGNVDWSAADKKVTIRKGTHYVELWVGQTEMIADGTKTSSDAAPIIRNNRTLLPLRFVSEQLGLNVVWDAATRGITIQEP
ncbi:stalk domain-containing protein [Paenibacillus sp. TRM 82003]|nr:stalk domain-containing protein [Paenibacillus sp. TRM 82003]MCI3923421.1 stalk domain-containing protein [Paenibacillus sp. TRM 82003]